MTRHYGATFRSKKLKFFLQIYVLGIVLAGIAAAISVIESTLILPHIAFSIGVSHLFFLIYLGYRINDAQDCYRSYVLTQAGSRIQTAGYLHTLVGFLSAIAVTGRTGFSISDLSIPLASALITSLLGWLFGGEIAALGESESPDVEKEVRKVVLALESYSKKLEDIQKGYSQRLEKDYTQHVNNILAFQKNLTERLETEHKQRVDSMLTLQDEHFTSLKTAHEQYADNTIKFYEKCNNELETISRKIEKSSNNTSGSLEIFSRDLDLKREEIRISLEGFSSVIDRQKQGFQASLESYMSASTDMGAYSRNVADNMQSLSKNSMKANQDLTGILQSMAVASKNVQSWAKETGASVAAVKELLAELETNRERSYKG
jgi:methyl-accepting chemotaxis protein